MPPPKAVSSCCAIGCEGTRMATVSWPPVTTSCTLAARGSTMVSGPGQNLSASLRGGFGHLAHPAVQDTRTVEMHDDRMRSRAAFRLEDAAHGRGVLRVRAQPIDGFGRKRDELAVTQRLHGGFDLDLTGANNSYHGARILSCRALAGACSCIMFAAASANASLQACRENVPVFRRPGNANSVHRSLRVAPGVCYSRSWRSQPDSVRCSS